MSNESENEGLLSTEEAVEKYDGKETTSTENEMRQDLGEFRADHLKAVRNGRIVEVDGILTDKAYQEFLVLWNENHDNNYGETWRTKYACADHMRTHAARYGFSDVDDDEGHFGWGHTTEKWSKQLADMPVLFPKLVVLVSASDLLHRCATDKQRREQWYENHGKIAPWNASE